MSRKWLATIVSAEETSTQIEIAFIAFTDALASEGLLAGVEARALVPAEPCCKVRTHVGSASEPRAREPAEARRCLMRHLTSAV